MLEGERGAFFISANGDVDWYHIDTGVGIDKKIELQYSVSLSSLTTRTVIY